MCWSAGVEDLENPRWLGERIRPCDVQSAASVIDARLGDAGQLFHSTFDAPDAGATVLAQNFGICREAIDRNAQWQAWAVAAGLAPKPEPGAE